MQSTTDKADIIEINAVIEVFWESESTRLRPFSQSIPLPLFPSKYLLIEIIDELLVGGYPMIFHHLQALEKLSSQYKVKHVYLHGKYLVEDFLPFIDSVIHRFGFTIEYLQEEDQASQQLGIPALYKHREMIMKGDPDFIFVMNCDICSSFPLYDMLKF